MSDYLQRLLQRSQPTPLHRLPAPARPVMPAFAGEGDSVVDPFAAAVAPDLDERTAPATGATTAAQEPARSLVAPIPTPGALALGGAATHATADAQSNVPQPVASQANQLSAAKPPVPALSSTPGRPQQAAGSSVMHGSGRAVQPSIADEQTAASTLPPQPRVAAGISAEGEKVVQDEVEKTVAQPAPPEPGIAGTDFSADLQALLRQLQGSGQGEDEAAALRAGDSQPRQFSRAAPEPTQALTPTAVPAALTAERRQLSIGRLIVEVTPAAPPTLVAPARPAQYRHPAPQPQTGVTSKLRFGIGQL